MQLVVMVAVLALARAGQGCSFGCHPTNISIQVESCGLTEVIYTTICEGQCYHEDLVYLSHYERPEQRICNGDWSYEVKHIKGCPVGVTYPVARNCECTTCNTENTDCGRFPGDIPSCLSF
ncbi:gonadotropin subunit beta-1 isoform X2 [Dicentrarchus labrax]|uniref:GTH-1 beta subunit n=2 Tax=Dicentrarchus labrax TaxID=13489 RepID=Q8AY98_DICLA|nr:gonadotropin subunit beta-1 isoform X2 [Dicentrarchus labrax]XP_051234913.1 gonadotropin subunit beta-1 isoform X2 [Dicentrarchus labrax]XP_051234914.1 gonadotropin subunit beta-1 isoform X2 [Dicentrarchus labrax]AAN40506.1 GTH-1 beta subunit [Dicentrarchus labrax]